MVKQVYFDNKAKHNLSNLIEAIMQVVNHKAWKLIQGFKSMKPQHYLSKLFQSIKGNTTKFVQINKS